ncbi:hypothetical protein [Bacillus sp. Marseille-P3800]|uniref:hypothetical protein n=1 Tax=Bacillus sp. Marseille-P3800 TaxID=2014782 RepID=UPI000C071653|nr:hypothetical protein [Bacillus sp. Marseille-P3800]
MIKYEVDLKITHTFTTKVEIEGYFFGKEDIAVLKQAKGKALSMGEDKWNYEDTNVSVIAIKDKFL